MRIKQASHLNTCLKDEGRLCQEHPFSTDIPPTWEHSVFEASKWQVQCDDFSRLLYPGHLFLPKGVKLDNFRRCTFAILLRRLFAIGAVFRDRQFTKCR